MTTAPAPTFASVRDELDRRRRVTMGLERVERLLALLGDPQKKLRVVQVVGTNGKGTTAVALATALAEAGQPAGAYLSPHVLSYTERAMIGGRFVDEERFAAAMAGAIRASDAHGVGASQFELLTAGAVKLFADEGLRWAVLEAGLGARHDATSAARAEAVVLTNVGLDHAEYLGETVEEVAREKLASLAAGSALILGDVPPGVRALARGRCAEVNARLVETKNEAEHAAPKDVAPYAARDAGLGILAAEELLGEPFGDGARERVTRRATGVLPGRFERTEIEGVPVAVDGGHNEAGIGAALEAVSAVYGERPLVVVFGVLRRKDARSMLTSLRRRARRVVLTRPEDEGGVEPEGIAREQGMGSDEGSRPLVVGDPVEAVRRAVREARAVGGTVLVVGSFRVVAPVLRWTRDG